jgi:DNA-binding beta-propeller fold protein YncE
MTNAAARRPSFALLIVTVLLLGTGLVAAPADARAGGVPADSPARSGYEVWSVDQGTDRIHVYDSADYREVATIDLSPAALADRGFQHVPAGPRTVPHMIDFDSQDRYAFVAATAGAATIVIDARTKQVLEVLGTGAGSHMTAVTPDDTTAWVAAIGTQQLVEIELGKLNSARPTFEIGARLNVADLLAPIEAANPDWQRVVPAEGPFSYASYSPVCHQFSPDSTEAWVTLGPGWPQGGLFVLDLATHAVSAAWDPSEVKANCGTSVSDDLALANFSGEVVAGADTAGEWYVFDRASKQLIETHSAADGPVQGLDAHGLRLTPDGSHYWMVNRASSDGVVVRASDRTVVRHLTSGLEAPDILDFAPDGSRVYVSQRGPSPLSGAPHAATGDEPGIAVLDAATGERVAFLAPTAVIVDDRVQNDVHGVGIRTVGPGERTGLDRAAQRRP